MKFTTTGPFPAAGTSTDAAGNVSAGAAYAGNVAADAPAVAFSSCPAQVILAGPQSIDWTRVIGAQASTVRHPAASRSTPRRSERTR